MGVKKRLVFNTVSRLNRGGDMSGETLKEKLYNTYMNYYVEGFKANDVGMIDKIVKYPIAYIKDGTVRMCDRYPIDPRSLKEEKQWDHSIDWKFEITAVNQQEAHAVASAVRCRKDGSVIESVHGFYAFTLIEGEWKMYALADNTY